MTNEQKQCLLYFLGYYEGKIDGEWGEKSKEATEKFQRKYGLTVDGIFGNATKKKILSVVGSWTKNTTNAASKSWWDDIKYFDREEFRCTCKGKYCNGFPVEPDKELVQILDKVRKRFGKPFTPNSAIRCKKRNADPDVGGASNSQHLYGTAADISVPGVKPKTVAAYIETLLPNTGGIGVYGWGVHVDVRKTKSRWNG